MSRIGTGLLWAGGLVLAALMAYTLTLGGGTATSTHRGATSAGVAEVAVVFPERVYWVEFRQGVLACVRRKIARLVEEGDDALLVETPRYGRRLRFSFHEARGLRETRDEVGRLIASPAPPVAVVGSSNTVLTAALADALRATGGAEGNHGPVLLIPWATSDLVERAEPDAGPVALLDIDPGRTFRFCPNNQRQADLVARCLADHDAGATLERAYIIEDRHDPYSVDLSSCFHRVIERIAPRAELIDHADSLEYSGIAGLAGMPGPSEEALAEKIWHAAEKDPAGRTTWVVLPLQEAPAQRILLALGRHRRAEQPRDRCPLRVLCGDAIGLKVLAPWAGKLPFPIWGVSFDALPGPDAGRLPGGTLATNVQLHAEIVSAVVRCLDLPPGRPIAADALRAALASLSIKADEPGALGRSIAFTKAGERGGDDLGHVLLVRPDRDEVDALTRGGSGRWNAAVPVRPIPFPSPDEARP
jgi:hypothetical protein